MNDARPERDQANRWYQFRLTTLIALVILAKSCRWRLLLHRQHLIEFIETVELAGSLQIRTVNLCRLPEFMRKRNEDYGQDQECCVADPTSPGADWCDVV